MLNFEHFVPKFRKWWFRIKVACSRLRGNTLHAILVILSEGCLFKSRPGQLFCCTEICCTCFNIFIKILLFPSSNKEIHKIGELIKYVYLVTKPGNICDFCAFEGIKDIERENLVLKKT